MNATIQHVGYAVIIFIPKIEWVSKLSKNLNLSISPINIFSLIQQCNETKAAKNDKN